MKIIAMLCFVILFFPKYATGETCDYRCETEQLRVERDMLREQFRHERDRSRYDYGRRGGYGRGYYGRYYREPEYGLGSTRPEQGTEFSDEGFQWRSYR